MEHKSVFKNDDNNNNDNNNNPPISAWGNPQISNNPFQFTNDNSQSAFSVWGNNNNTNTNTTTHTNTNTANTNSTNLFASPFKFTNDNPFGTTTTPNANTTNNTPQSAFTHTSNTHTKTPTNTWWSTNTTNNNNNANTTTNNNWITNGGNSMNENKIDDDNSMDGNHSQSFTNFNTNPPPPPPPKAKPKPKSNGRLQATAESKLFLGSWKLKTGLVYITMKRKQSDPNLLVGLCDNYPRYELKVTGFGLATRTELPNGHKLHGIIHLNSQRKGVLSILWYDDHENHQHYWNQAGCNKHPCTFAENCKFAHINDTVTQQLQVNNKRALQLQEKKKNKHHNNSNKKPPFSNKVYTFNTDQNKTEAKDKHTTNTSVILKSGIRFSPKTNKNNKTNTNNTAEPPPKPMLPKTLTSFKNPLHKTEGLSFTTTYFDTNGSSVGTVISTQNAATSNSINIPPKNNPNSVQYSFDDQPNNMDHANMNHNNTNNANMNHSNMSNNGNMSITVPNNSKLHRDRSSSPVVSIDTEHKPGECYLMCPLTECSMRLGTNQVRRKFEMDPQRQCTKYSLIKEYSKSNAGQQINLKDVRCGSVLRLTLQYLMNVTLNNNNIAFAHRFAFLQDRIRSIVKDLYMQHLSVFDKESTIQLLEVSVRFRIFSHLLICHMDQHIVQQTAPFPASTQYQSAFLNQDINDKNPFTQQYSYSAKQNLVHLPNIFSNLFSLYKCRQFEQLPAALQKDEIEIYCLAAYHKLVQGALEYTVNSNYQHFAKEVLCNIGVPVYVRRDWRVQMARKLIDAYTTMNHILFFKLYRKLSVLERAILYPILDKFRLVCIRKMCTRGAVRMPPNASYKFADFVRGFGFYVGVNGCMSSVDATDFLVWYGGFDGNDMNNICRNGLAMDDLVKLKLRRDAKRFAARDKFLIDMDKYGVQQLMQGAAYRKVDGVQFMNVFMRIEAANNIEVVDQEINKLLSCGAVSDGGNMSMFPPKINNIVIPAKINNLPPKINNTQSNFRQFTHSESPAVTGGFAGFLSKNQQSVSNNNANGSSWPAPAIQPSASMKVEPAPPPPTPPQPTHETLAKIISAHDRALQSMAENDQWNELRLKLSKIKEKYQSHPQWLGIEAWFKTYRKKQRLALKTDWSKVKKSNRDWNLFYIFRQKWIDITPEQIKKVTAEIKRNWFRFHKNEIVYYKKRRFTVADITFNTPTAPKLHLFNKNKQLQLDMFDASIITEKEYTVNNERERRKKEKAEKEKIAALKLKQEQERQRKEAELAALRAKLLQEKRKKQEKKARKELERKRSIALRKCNDIYTQLKLRRFVLDWQRKANELSTIRKHYRLSSADDILCKTQSIKNTLLLLQAHSPAKINRKRKTPQPCFNDNGSDLHIKRTKFNKNSNVGGVAWDYTELIHILYERNKNGLNMMLHNSENINYNNMHPMELVFNILISVSEDKEYNELILYNFGCLQNEELFKKVYVCNNMRLHYCVITDNKIKSIGAQSANCVRGFQGYVHLLAGVTALLDCDNSKWSLNKQHINDLIHGLKKEKKKINDNLILLHENSSCCMLILLKCQPLNIQLRDNENTLIELRENDIEIIRNVLGINNNWPIKIIGITSYNDRDIFKYCMDWMVKYSPKYPYLYRIKSGKIMNNIFEKIFDSKPGLFTMEEKVTFWNGEIEKIKGNILKGIHRNVSWPPCCFDDRHELVLNKILPVSSWNDNNNKQNILSSLNKLKINCINSHVNNIEIVQRISELDEYWWTMTDIQTKLNEDIYQNNNHNHNNTDSSMSDTSTFNIENENENENDQESLQSVQLVEFEQLVNAISTDFDETLTGLQSCSDVIKAMNDRITDLQFK